MKVLVAGSFPGHVGGTGQRSTKQHQPLFDACSALGQELAAAGHTLLVGSDSPNTADYHVALGFVEEAQRRREHSFTIEIHRPDDAKVPYTQLPANVIVQRHRHLPSGPGSNKWFVAHVLALDSCDALLTIGGGASTRVLGKIAAGRGAPVLAVRTFGGSSAELFDHLSLLYQHQYGLRAEIDSALSTWHPGSARQAIALLDQLAEASAETKHSYFLSYSWKDFAEADHVETVLRRNNRPVNRDESAIDLGDGLNEAIRGLIEASDTYVALLSQNFEESDWCPDERQYARQRKSKGLKPRRIIELVISDDLTEELGEELKAIASHREQRELKIRQAIEQE